jgi:glycine/D-amino acid oxidase-like deaminating enzyme
MGHYRTWTPSAVPVFPVKGQILTVYAAPPPIRSITFGHGAYIFPRVDGTMVVGATYEPLGFDKTLTAKGLGWLLTLIPRLCPTLADARIDRMWVGLRPGSADELPIIGPAPGTDNVTLAAGHFRNGIMLAPITADLVAELVLRETLHDLLKPFSPARFA